MNTFLNVLWHFPFFGFILAILTAITGLLFCISIIGLPIGLGLLQFSLFLFWPHGYAMVSKSDLELLTEKKRPLWWKIFALIIRIFYFPIGLIEAVVMSFFGLLEFISLIGIPQGLVTMKSISTYFNPVNKVRVPQAVADQIKEIKRERAIQRYAPKKQQPEQNPYAQQPTAPKPAVQEPVMQQMPEQPELQPELQPAMMQSDIQMPATELPQNVIEGGESATCTPAIQQPTAFYQQEEPQTDTYVEEPEKKNMIKIAAIAVSVLAVIGAIAGYFLWYVPYATDRDAPRTYVVADNLFLRSSKIAGVEYNIIGKIPYGSELITYSDDGQWAEVKANGMEGFVASPYLINNESFNALHNIWGTLDVKTYIESTKCRLALLDFCNRENLTTGTSGWQLFTLQKEVKPNNVMFPRLANGYDKFTEFAFILKNNTTGARILAIYSFDEESEKPIFLHKEDVSSNGQIKDIKYMSRNDEYKVTYSY